MMNTVSRKGIKKTLIMLSIVCVMVFVALITVLGAETYTQQRGITNVSGSRLNVRSGVGTSTTVIGRLEDQTYVTIIGEDSDTDGVKWYKIEFTSELQDYGYVSSQYITIIPNVSGDTTTDETTDGETSGDDTPSKLPDMTDFEAYLDEQGFPESYKPYLRELHAIYPNWIFKAQKTGFDFDYAVSQELQQSLVWNGSISSWKSTADGDYNWDSNQWTGYDGANWVRASQGIIEHYMDPRNFLGINTVFQFLEQSFDENIQTVDGVKQIIAGTFMEKDVVDVDGTTLNYATAIYNAGKEFGVNPYVLAAMIVQEQGTQGTSRIISGNVSGYKNLFNYYNIGAWATPQFGNDAVIRGLWYAGAGTSNLRPWNTRLKAIRGGASFYAANYTNSGQTTLYLKKFNVQGERPFTGQYMTNIQGAASEASEISQGYSNEMRTSPLSFLIPIYENMHESPCPKPTKDGSPNMKLSSLKVDGYELTPGFERDITEYMIVVPENLSKITINAAALEASAVISGIGEIEIPEKQNVLEVVVTAGNGDVRIYTITVAKEDPEIIGKVSFSDKYAINGLYVYRIAPGTTVEQFVKAFMIEGRAVVVDAAGAEMADGDILKTGCQVNVYNTINEHYGVFYISVLGDIDADGNITMGDLLKVRNQILKRANFTELQIFSGDIDSDGNITMGDLLKIRNHILGTKLFS